MPSVDTREVFDLHRVWNDATLANNAAEQNTAFVELTNRGHNPTNMGINADQRRTELLNWERRRLSFQHELHALGMHTLVGPKIPGTVSETSVAYLLDSKGRGRVGQSAGGNGLGGSDLVNGFEVKEAARTFLNIDMVFSGHIVRRGTHVWIHIDQEQTDSRTFEQLNGNLAGVMKQISNKPCAVQRLDENRICVSNSYWKTKGKKSIIQIETNADDLRGIREWDDNLGDLGAWLEANTNYSRRTFGNLPLPPDGTYVQLALGQWQNIDQALDGASFEFRITQERPHFNLGNYTGQQYAEMINQGIAFVSRHIDVDGRAGVAFMTLNTPNLEAAQQIMDRPERPLNGNPYQFQPYLYFDNVRHSLYDNENNGLMNLGALLHAYYLEDEDDLQEIFWDPEGQPLADNNIQQLLTTSQTGTDLTNHDGEVLGPPRPVRDYRLFVDIGNGPVLYNHSIQDHRHQMMDNFADSLCTFYRDSRYYTDWTNTARKIFSGKECEIFTSLYSGLRGCRSMARGADIFETNGQESECKQVTGRSGDMMFSIHANPPLHLRRPAGILEWNRLFVTSMEDRSEPAPTGLHLKLLIMCADPTLYDDAIQYMIHRPNSPDLQYDSDNYDSGAFGIANARPYLPSGGQIVPTRVFEFREGVGRIYWDGRFIEHCNNE